MEQLTRTQAIAFYDSNKWVDMTPLDRALFQMQQQCLCMPMDVFQIALQESLGRPIFTHEIALNHSEMLAELKALDGN